MATKPKTPKTPKTEFKVEKKRSGRYMVSERRTGKPVNGEKKVEVLVKEGLIKVLVKKKVEGEAPAAT